MLTGVGSESGRSASVDRHLTMIADLLAGREHDRQSLSDRLGVRPAMADRLIRAAVKNLPGVSERRDGKTRKVRMDLAAVLPAPEYPTAVAACFGASLWPVFKGSSYENGIRSALSHVVGRTKRRGVFKDIDRKFWFLRRGGEVALRERQSLLDDVIEAVLHHRVVSAEYTRFSGDDERLRLEPLSIVVHDHQLYVVARDAGGAPHPYRFSRLRSVDVLRETFAYPSRAEYDPERIFQDSFGIFVDPPVKQVHLRLHARWEVYARTHAWHDSQRVDFGADGVHVLLRVRLCPELEAWILGFGADAAVIGPVELRNRVARRAVATARLYAERTSSGKTRLKTRRPSRSSRRAPRS
jgi:predicted DNA-binding transcriptional regulator YafY